MKNSDLHLESKLYKGKPSSLLFIGLLGLKLTFGSTVLANPSGGSVVSGNVSIQGAGSTLNVNQLSDKAIVNWDSFSIANGQVTNFNQPSSTSAILNKVVGGNVSEIYGRLNANGKVYLMNSNGVLIGKSGVIHTNGFLATTHSLSNKDFLNGGDLTLKPGNKAGGASIINLGKISATGGDVFIIADHVLNKGNITAKNGTVGLAAARGSDVLLADSGNQRLLIKPSKSGATGKDGVVNEGEIKAMNAEIKASGGNIYSLAIKNSGSLRATGVQKKGGRILLTAGKGKIKLTKKSRIDASGKRGGGQVNIGGSRQGQGPIANAKDVTIEKGSRIHADATEEGDGGKIVVFGLGHTSVGGLLTAKGGQFGGDGGFIETSGIVGLDFDAVVDASAPKGNGGLWLIDPTTITIDRTMADAIEKSLDADTSVIVTTLANPAGSSETIPDVLQPNPDGVDQTVTGTTGDIIVSASITKRFSGQQQFYEREIKQRGDVPVGGHTQELAAGSDVVFLQTIERNGVTNDVNIISQKFMLRADAALEVRKNSVRFQIAETPLNLNLVYEVRRNEVVERAYKKTPTLELIAGNGSVIVHDPITSLNGALNVTLRTVNDVFAPTQNVGVEINANITTNGGHLTAHGHQLVKVQDGVRISTRDIFGSDLKKARFFSSENQSEILSKRTSLIAARPGFSTETISNEAFSNTNFLNGVSKGWSGDVNLVVDKEIGYSSFFLFYRSDLSEVSIGENVKIYAHTNSTEGDAQRDGSVNVYALANLTDLFEDVGWLGVRNYTEAKLTVGDGAEIRGGAVSLIADARADADVGGIIQRAAEEVFESAEATGLGPTVALNEDDRAFTTAERVTALLLDVNSSPHEIEKLLAGNPSDPTADLSGSSTGVKIPYAKIGKKLGKALPEVVDGIPYVGAALNFSPVAIAIGESNSLLNIGNNVTVIAGDLLTIRSNATSKTKGDSEAPGIALVLTNTNAESQLNVGSNSMLASTALDRVTPDGNFLLVDGKPLIEFTTNGGLFGINRNFLQDRKSLDAVEISSNANSITVAKVAAAALTSEGVDNLRQDAEKKRTKKVAKAIAAGGTYVGDGVQKRDGSIQKDKSVGLDSPIDVALGIGIIFNKAELNIAQGSKVEALKGSVEISSNTLVSSKFVVVGGKVSKPNVKADSESEGTVGEPYDANDILNVALSIQYIDNSAKTTVNGQVIARHVTIASNSVEKKNLNSAKSDNGYVNKTGKKLIEDKHSQDNEKLNIAITKIGNFIKGADKEVKKKIPVETTDPKAQEIGMAGAFALSINNHTVETIIGSNAIIESRDPISVDRSAILIYSKHASAQIHNSAASGVHAGRTNSAAAAIAIGVFNNDVTTSVSSGARITVNHGVNSPTLTAQEREKLGSLSAVEIFSETIIPSPFTVTKYQKKARKGLKLTDEKTFTDPKGYLEKLTDPKTLATRHINNLIKNGNLLTTSWANSYFIPGDVPKGPQSGDTSGAGATTSNLNKDTNKDGRSGVGAAGSFNLIAVENHAKTTIGDGAVIEVLGGTLGGRNDIDINSQSWGHIVMAAGNVAPVKLKGDITDGFKIDEFFTSKKPVGTGLGGAVNILAGNTSAETYVGAATIRSEKAKVIIDSHAHFETILVQLSGGRAEKNSFNGTLGVATIEHHAKALLSDDAILSADELVLTSRNDAPGHVVLSGGFAYGGAVGIGAGISILNVNRSTVAEVGHRPEGDTTTTGNLTINDLYLRSSSTGFLTTVGLAGGVTKKPGATEKLSGGADLTASQNTGSGDQANSSTGGVGISGSVTVNNINSSTTARLMAPNGVIRRSALVQSRDATDTKGISGGASLSLSGGVAVAGAASINRISSNTQALVVDTDIFSGHYFNVDSSSIGRIIGISAGVAIVANDPTSGSSSSTNVAVAGAFVFNEINNNTYAKLLNSNLTISPERFDDGLLEEQKEILRLIRKLLPEVTVTANDGSQITAIAGAVALTLTPDSAASVGAGVAVNIMQGRVESTIGGSVLSGMSDGRGVIVAANRIAPIYSFGIAGAAGSSSLAASASVGVNIIDTLPDKGTYASVVNSQITGLRDLSIQSGNESQIFSLAGAFAATSDNVAVGGSLSYSEIGGDVSAVMEGSTVSLNGDVHVLSSTSAATATRDAEIDFNQVIADGAKTIKDIQGIVTGGILGVIALRDEKNPPVVQPVDTIDLFEGQSSIISLAVAGGGSSNVAVFGSGTINIINTDVTTVIKDSNVTSSSGSLTSFALNGAAIYSAAGSLAISTGNVSVGGAVNYNTLRGTTQSTVSDSTFMVSGAVDILSDRTGNVGTVAVAGGISSSVAVTGSTAISTHADKVKTDILGSTINAGSINVLANESVTNLTITGGAAGAGTVAVGASLGIVVAENSAHTRVASSALNHSSLTTTGLMSIRSMTSEQYTTNAVTLAVSGAVGVAGSIGIKVINSESRAEIGDHTIMKGSLTGGSVLVQSDSNLISTGAAGAIGGAQYVGVGAALDITVLNGTSYATVGDGVLIEGDNVSVLAKSQKDIGALSAAGGGGLVGVAGGVNVVHVGGGTQDAKASEALGISSYEDPEGKMQQAGNVQVYAQGKLNDKYTDATIRTTGTEVPVGDTVASVGGSVINARNNLTVQAVGLHDVDSIAGIVAAGGVGAGAGVSSVTYNNRTVAATQNATLSANGTVKVEALDRDQSTFRHYFLFDGAGTRAVAEFNFTDYDAFRNDSAAGTGGLAALGAAVSVTNRDTYTNALIQGGSVTKGSLVVNADRQRRNIVGAHGIQGGGVAVGAAVAVLDLDGNVVAKAGGQLGTQSARLNGVSLRAQASGYDTAAAYASSAGVIAGTAAAANVDGVNANTVEASLFNDTNLYSSNSVLIDAFVDVDQYALATGASISVAGASVGVSSSFVGADTNAKVSFGDRSVIDLDGSVGLTARARINASEDGFYRDLGLQSISSSFASAGGVSVGGFTAAVSEVDQDNITSLLVGESVSIKGSLVRLSSNSKNYTVAQAGQVNFAAGLSAGIGSSTNKSSTRSTITVGSLASIESGLLEINSTTYHAPRVANNSIAGALFNSSGVQVSAVDSDFAEAKVSILDRATINVLNNFHVNADNLLSYITQSVVSAGSGITTNTTDSTVLGQRGVNAEVLLDGASLTGLNALNIRAKNNVYGNLYSEGFAAAAVASAKSEIKTNILGTSQVNLTGSARLEAKDINVISDLLQSNFTAVSKSKGTLLSTSTLEHNMNMSQLISIGNNAKIFSNDVNLTAKPSAIVSTLSELEGIGGDIAKTPIKNEIITNRVNFDGEIHLIPSFGTSLNIDFKLGKFVTVNGQFVDGGVASASNGNTVHDLGSVGAKGKVVFDTASTGIVIGSGSIIDSSSTIKEVNITSVNEEVTINDILGNADVGAVATADITKVSSNTHDFTIVAGPEVATVVNVDLGSAALQLEGRIYTGKQGRITLSAGEILSAAGATLEAKDISLSTTGFTGTSLYKGSIVAKTIFTGEGESSFTASGRSDINIEMSLADFAGNTVNVGDITNNGNISLLINPRATAATYNLNGDIAGFGAISIDAGTSTDLALRVNGKISSTATPVSEGYYVNISNDAANNIVLESNYQQIERLRNKVISNTDVTIDDIVVPESGIMLTSGNLAGTGTIDGAVTALGLEINNTASSLSQLFIGGIDLRGSSTGVTINGDSNIISGQFGSIQIVKEGKTGLSTDIVINEHKRNRTLTALYVTGGIRTTGNIIFDLPETDTFTLGGILGSNPSIVANGFDINAPQLQSLAGSSGAPALIDVGAGGLSAQLAATANINVKDSSGDLYIKNLNLGIGSNLNLEAADGSIYTDAQSQLVVPNRSKFYASKDVILNGNDRILLGGDISVRGQNVAIRNVKGINISSDSALASLHLQTIDSEDINSLSSLTVTGDTTIVGGKNILLASNENDFQGAFSYSGRADELVLVDKNDLTLGASSLGVAGADTTDFRVTAGGKISQNGELSVSGNLHLKATEAALTNVGNAFHGTIHLNGGDVSIRNTRASVLGLVDLSGDFSIHSDGAITQHTTSQLKVGGNAEFISDTDLTLTNSVDLNSVSGSVRAFELTNLGDLVFNGFTSSEFTKVTAGGNITDSVAGLDVKSLQFSTAGDVVLDSENNLIRRISASSAANVTIVDRNGSGLFVESLSTSGHLGLDANSLAFESSFGNIIVNSLDLKARQGSINLLDAGPQLLVAGTAAFEARDTINIAKARFRGAVSVKAKNAFITHNLAGSGSIDFAGVDVANTFQLINPNGGVTDSGAVKIGGLAIFQADASSVNGDGTAFNGHVILDHHGNNFKDVQINTFNDLHLFDVDNLNLNLSRSVAGNNVGNLTINAGSLFYEGAKGIESGGNVDLTLRYGRFNNLGAKPDFTKAVGNLSINAGRSIDLVNANVGGELSLTAAGEMRLANLDVGGDASLTAGVGIRLENSDIGGDATLSARGGITYKALATNSVNSLSLRSGHDIVVEKLHSSSGVSTSGGSIKISELTAENSARVTAAIVELGPVNVAGDFTVTPSNGAQHGSLTFTDSITVGGSTTLSTRHDLALTHADNDFGGALNLHSHSGGNHGYTIVDKNDLTLGVITGGSNISFTAGGELSGNSAIRASGNAIFSAGSGRDLSLNNTASNIGGLVTLSGANVSVLTGGHLNILSATSTGDMALTSDSISINNGNPLLVGGNFDLTSNGDVLTNQSVGNKIDGVINVHRGGLTYYQDTDVTLGDINATSSFGVVTSGKITMTKPLKVAGDLHLEHSAAIDLTSQDHVLGGKMTLIGTEVDVRRTGLARFGKISATNGDINVTADSITLVQNGVNDRVSATGSVNLTATNGDIVGQNYFAEIHADSLNVAASGIVRIKGSVAKAINASAADLQFDLSGNVDLGNITATTGGLEVKATGNVSITRSGLLDIAEDLKLLNSVGRAGREIPTGTLILDTENQKIGGKLHLTAENISVVAPGDLRIANISAGLFTAGGGARPGQVSVIVAGNLSIDEIVSGQASIEAAGDLSIARVTADDASIVSSNGGITVDSIGVLGVGELNASGDILVKHVSGTLDIVGQNVSLVASRGFALKQLDARGDLDIRVQQEDLTQTSNSSLTDRIKVGGNTHIESLNHVLIAGDPRFDGFNPAGRIVYDNPNNNFSGEVTVVGTEVTLATQGTLHLGEIHSEGAFTQGIFPATGALNLTSATGDIIGLKRIRSGTLTASVSDGHDITLTHSLNGIGELRGAISGTDDLVINRYGSTGKVRNVDVRSAITLRLSAIDTAGTLKIDGANNVTANGDLKSGGDMLIRARNGNLGITGIVAGESKVTLAAGRNFLNGSGQDSPISADDRWVVYSTRPDQNRTANALGEDFIEYSVAFNPADPNFSSNPTANGMLYSVTPVIEGLTINANDQTIAYGESINTDILTAGGTLGGAKGSKVFVNGAEVNAATFGIDLVNLSVAQNNLQIGVNESIVTRSTSDHIIAGNYTGALIVTLKDTAGGSVRGLGLGSSANLVVTPRDISINDLAVANKVYDRTDDATVTHTGFTGVISGDVVQLGSAKFADNQAGDNKSVTISGGIVGADARNYNLTTSLTGLAANITKRELTVTSADIDDKTYDGSTSATFDNTIFTGKIELDNISLTGGIAAFDTKHADTGKTVTISGFSITGTDANNYVISSVPYTGVAEIKQKEISVSGVSALDKVYDGTRVAQITGGTVDDLIMGDDVTISGSDATFASKNAGNNIGVTVSNYTLSGADAKNYRVTGGPTGLTANITPKSISLDGVVVLNKTYDGTTNADVIGGYFNGVLSDDKVNLTLGGASFADANAGTDKAVTLSALSISGDDAGNYNLVAPKSFTANISQARLSVSGVTAENKVYDGQVSASLTGGILSGVIGSDDVTLVNGSGIFSDKNAGVGKEVSATGFNITGAQAANYIVDTSITGLTADIERKEASITGLSAQNKVYDGTTSAIITGGLINGVLSGDDLSISNGSAVYASKDVASGIAVNLSGYSLTGADAANYKLSSDPAALTGDITARELSITGVTAENKVYDGNRVATLTGGTLSGVVLSETVGFTVGSGEFSDQNVGSDKTVNITGITLTGNADVLKNYTFSGQPTGIKADISAKSVSIAGIVAQDRAYDGTTKVTLNGAYIDGVVGLDFLDLTIGSGSFNDKNVGVDKEVTVSGFAIGGVNAGNYILTEQPTGIKATVRQKELTINDVTAMNKVYDGDVSASLSGGSLEGVVSGDSVNFTLGTGNFENANAGSGKSVTAAGFTLNGLDTNNYILKGQPKGITADISRKGLSVSGVTALDRTYDGTRSVTITGGSLLGVVNSDDVSLSTGEGFFSDKNVGTDKAVALSGFTLSGLASANYEISDYTGGVTASITQKAIAIGSLKAEKIYDGSNIATISGELEGLILGDDVDFSSIDTTFADKNVGSNKSVKMLGTTITGGDASNYSLVKPRDIEGNIYRKNVTVVEIKNLSKVYDGTTGISLQDHSFEGIIAGDTVNLVNGTATYADKNVGIGKVITLDGYSTDNKNYNLVMPKTALGQITQKSITLSGLAAQDKVYNGNATATITGGSLNGVITGDTVGFTHGSALFADKNAGVDKVVNLSGYTIDNGNYRLIQPSALKANIARKSVNISIDDVAREFGQTTPSFTGTVSGFLDGDNLTVGYSSQATVSTPAGIYASDSTLGIMALINDPDGKLSNYSVNTTGGTLVISGTPVIPEVLHNNPALWDIVNRWGYHVNTDRKLASAVYLYQSPKGVTLRRLLKLEEDNLKDKKEMSEKDKNKLEGIFTELFSSL